MILLVFLLSLLSGTLLSASMGQSFILTLPENSDSKSLRAWLAATKPAGVMLLASHVKNRTATKELTTFLQYEAKKLKIYPLIIATDWEGGIVSRPSEAGGFHSVPSPWLLAQLGPQACFKAGLLIGRQMHSVGITMDFAPSLDLFGKKILATRCFAADENSVATCGIAFAKGLMHAGIMAVIKHFPGLGFGRADTHHKQITIDIDPALHTRQMQPFLQALHAGVPALMSTHGIYKDFGAVPVTRSAEAVRQLRAKNPQAILITDDFEMHAAWDDVGQEKAIREALSAGYDYIVLSGKPTEQIKIIQNLSKRSFLALQAGAHSTSSGRAGKKDHCAMLSALPACHSSCPPKLPEGSMELVDLSAVATIGHRLEGRSSKSEKERTKRKVLKPQTDIAINEKALAQNLATACLQATYIPPLTNKKIIMITTQLPIIRPPEQWFLRDDESFLHSCLTEQGTHIIDEFVLNPKSPASLEQLAAIMTVIKKHPDATLLLQTFFYADAIWNTIQSQWLNKLVPYADRIITVSLGHPEEEKLLPEAINIPLGSFHKPLLLALAQRLANPVTQGIDALAAAPEQYLQDKRFGVVCNTSSITLDNKFLPDVLYQWTNKQDDATKLTALFSPEHGLHGTHAAYGDVPSEKTSAWLCPVFSLHGKHKKPTPDMLKNIDVMIIALPDVGLRCFTYLSTVDLVLQACSEHDIPVIVLDSINPIYSWGAQGPELNPDYKSFAGRAPVPFLHGSTIGSIADQINKSYKNDLKALSSNYKPDFTMGYLFKAPSPNLMTIDHVHAYPLTVLLEGTNYSEGRGTTSPFLQIGAPWVSAHKLAEALNQRKLPGVYFQPISFTPRAMPGFSDKPKHENLQCQGVFIHILDHQALEPATTAEIIIQELFRLYPAESDFITWGKTYFLDNLYGNNSLRLSLQPARA